MVVIVYREHGVRPKIPHKNVYKMKASCRLLTIYVIAIASWRKMHSNGYMNTRTIFSIVLTGFVAIRFGVSQEPETTTTTTALETLKQERSTFEAGLDQPLKEWKADFLVALRSAQEKVQTSGDLDQVVLIRNIVENPEAPVKIPARYTSLKRFHNLQMNKRNDIVRQIATQRRKGLVSYRQKLLQLQNDLTTQGEIDAALEVKAEVATVEELIRADAPLVAGGAETASAPPRGNRNPGRLVVFGANSSGEPITLSEEMKRERFVRVVAGYDDWYAITPQGKLVYGGNSNVKGPPEDMTKPVVDVIVGRHYGFAVHPDGSFTGLGGSDHGDTMPDIVKSAPVRHIAAGHSLNVVVLRNGKAIPCGYQLRPPSRYINSRNILEGTVRAAATSGSFWLIKRDGSIVSSKLTGEAVDNRPDALDGQRIIDVRSGVSTHGVIMMTSERKLISWNSLEIPPDLGPVRQYRVGYSLLGVQKRDGSWQVFGREPLATNVNQLLSRAGPLKDFTLGGNYFIGIR